MANERLNIPKEIKVGYQKRQDTFSGKLAYVTYTKPDGSTAKECSWDGWRDKKINPDIFKNKPITGFVLNKRAGGEKYSWNKRQTYCRVYDPRGFEIEITVDNLLYILDLCDCNKGKGLEGEFIYAWDKKDLILLPAVSPDFQESIELIRKKEALKDKDLIPGSAYKSKFCDYLIYIGKEKFYALVSEQSSGYSRTKLNYKYNVKTRNLKIFVEKDYKTIHAIDNISTNLDYKIEDGILREDEIKNWKHENYSKIVYLNNPEKLKELKPILVSSCSGKYTAETLKQDFLNLKYLGRKSTKIYGEVYLYVRDMLKTLPFIKTLGINQYNVFSVSRPANNWPRAVNVDELTCTREEWIEQVYKDLENYKYSSIKVDGGGYIFKLISGQLYREDNTSATILDKENILLLGTYYYKALKTQEPVIEGLDEICSEYYRLALFNDEDKEVAVLGPWDKGLEPHIEIKL